MGAAARRQRGAGPVAGRPSGASAPDHITGFRSTTQRGSAGWVQRHAGPVAGRCKNSPETGEFCFVSQPFPWRLAAQAPGQSHRRHSPPPPFAQGRLLCPIASGQPFPWRLAPTGPRREAGKRSGKNLVFPRGTAAASPNNLQVILALCQNNTPPMAQEGPGGFRRREETWGSLPRREGSAPISPGVPFPFWRFRLPLP